MTDDDTSLFGQLRRGAGSLWRDYVDHPFVRGLGDGSLPQSAFRHYLVQDYLFLIHFVRAYALAGYKSTRLEDLHAAASGMAALLAEMTLHVAYCAEWGIGEPEMEAEPECVETVAYTRFVLDRGTAGDLLDLHVALAPCILGYAEIGSALQGRGGAANPYAAWIASYAGAEYQEAAGSAEATLERIGARSGAGMRLADLQASFNTAVRLETAFWDMGWRAGLPPAMP
ncbi:TenA family protein [Acidisphaera sp. L21]|uniref:TenA family protein n=1 Tax=Acidisphaera sp. L21 TaxID=1641851 RepID=UPI00131DEA78|nr:TenA family protein [Acidisphaera sp. L21]